MSDGKPEDDRRAASRHLTCFPFNVQTGEAGDTQDMEVALIRDASPTGAFLLTGTEIPVGTRVKLHLDFLAPRGAIEGRVVRSERRPRDQSDVWPFGAAVQFSDANEELEPKLLELSKALEDALK